jgi:ABC-type lipopolysaccharide export system ATPase subunit
LHPAGTQYATTGKALYMKKAKWVRQTIHRIRDRELRGHLTNLYRAVDHKIKAPDAHTSLMDRLERRIISSARDTHERHRYILLSDHPVIDRIPQEHEDVQQVILHLLNEGHARIHTDHDALQKLEEIISLYHHTISNAEKRQQDALWIP